MPRVEYAVGLLMDPARQGVVLVKKERPAWQRGLWNGPGGRVEPGELPAIAVQRKFEEEVGVLIPAPYWTAMVTLHADRRGDEAVGAIVHFLAAAEERFWKAETRTDEVVQSFSVWNLPHDLMPNLRWMIPMARFDLRASWPYEVFESGQRSGQAAGAEPRPGG